MNRESVNVRHRSVSITVFPWTHPTGRDYWRFKHNGRTVTRASLEKAKAEALAACRSTLRGSIDLDSLTAEQATACQRMIAADPTCRSVDEFLVWHSKARPRKSSEEAVSEFLREKRTNAGSSPHNVTTLKRHLSMIPNMIVSDITPHHLPALTGAPRTRRNVRAAWITFFKWCQRMEYLPHGEKTAAERIGKPIVVRGVPSTWTPSELKILLSNVRRPYLPWLSLCALGACRTEEVIPQQGSSKPPLAWEDIHFDRDLIIVRAVTSKTGERRVIPLCAALKAILQPLAGKGVIGPHLYPSKPSTHGSFSETTRLGALVGGWRRNALRHSYISYRAAIVGLAQTAMEAGNSESEARRSYNDAKSREEAEEWFNVHQMFTSNLKATESR